MQDSQLATISNFIWNIADTVLRDLYVRGKYRDVILPMTVIRRLDAVLESTKQQVLEEKKWLDEAGISDQTGPPPAGGGTAVLQRLPFHPQGPEERHLPAAAPRQLQRLPGRVFTQRPRHPGEVRVPKPDSQALDQRRTRHPH